MSTDDFFVYSAVVQREYKNAFSGVPADSITLDRVPSDPVCLSFDGGDYTAVISGTLSGVAVNETITVETAERGYELFDTFSSIALSGWAGIAEVNIEAIRTDGTPYLVVDTVTNCDGYYLEASEGLVTTEGGELGRVRGNWICYLPEVDVQQFDLITMDSMTFTVVRQPKSFSSLVTGDFSHFECQVILEGADNV